MLSWRGQSPIQIRTAWLSAPWQSPACAASAGRLNFA